MLARGDCVIDPGCRACFPFIRGDKKMPPPTAAGEGSPAPQEEHPVRAPSHRRPRRAPAPLRARGADPAGTWEAPAAAPFISGRTKQPGSDKSVFKRGISGRRPRGSGLPSAPPPPAARTELSAEPTRFLAGLYVSTRDLQPQLVRCRLSRPAPLSSGEEVLFRSFLFCFVLYFSSSFKYYYHLSPVVERWRQQQPPVSAGCNPLCALAAPAATARFGCAVSIRAGEGALAAGIPPRPTPAPRWVDGMHVLPTRTPCFLGDGGPWATLHVFGLRRRAVALASPLTRPRGHLCWDVLLAIPLHREGPE